VRVPAVLHESNAIPGRVTRLLGRFCSAVAVGLPVAAERFRAAAPCSPALPVRSTFSRAAPAGLGALRAGPLLVVMGGSQGALGLNRMVRAVLPELLERAVGWCISRGATIPTWVNCSTPC
jgi:UDP-N-acetylglucosamine--N-acetylmuramyl-(pentapeptide) pyrophosphoryl-undecaprenol N-acetylglucosamine transferase